MFIIRETNWPTLKPKCTKIMQLLSQKGRIQSWIRIRNDPTPGQKVPIRPEPVVVNLLRSPGIDSQPGVPERQPYLTYRPARLHQTGGIDSWSPETFPNTASDPDLANALLRSSFPDAGCTSSSVRWPPST